MCGEMGQGFSLAVTLQPTQKGLAFLVLTPPPPSRALAMSVYFIHLSQSFTGEVQALGLLDVIAS